MKNHWLIAVALVTALASSASFATRRNAERAEAASLYRALEQYGYYYSSLRADEVRALESGDRAELDDVGQRLAYLADRLHALAVTGRLRHEVLEPIVQSLRADCDHLLSHSPTAQRNPANLFDPAIRQIGERFGFRHRTWRGRPLTA